METESSLPVSLLMKGISPNSTIMQDQHATAKDRAINASPTLEDFSSLVDLDEILNFHQHESRDHLLIPNSLEQEEDLGRDSPDSSDRKAVQIQLQENASLPTFHLKVDRTGSVPEPQRSDDFFLEMGRHDAHAMIPDPTPLADLQRKDHFRRTEPLPIPDIPSTKETPVKPAKQKKPAAKKTTTTPASIQTASNQKAKYGFGKKHVVSSVPGHAAYERKKQRAKDARVRLNESIDRLSMAMTIAGTASEQRNVMPWKCHDTARSLARCTAIADQAKKWDRPSFVGSAAAMIQALNAQCDALTKELRHATTAESPTKRRRLNGVVPSEGVDTDQATTAVNESATFQWADQLEPKLMQRIGGYLDPRSLGTNAAVCKKWNSWMKDIVLWEQLAIRRFGAIPVRQWNDRLEESGTDNVYHTMDSNNVMPHLLHVQTSALEMGQVRLPHRVSAWVHLRQRSNGETLQSVLNPATGMFSSMPIVQLWIVVQNTGLNEVLIPDQNIVVDASTRRRGEELAEVPGPRFQKRWLQLDGTEVDRSRRLKLFETIILEVNIHARGCSTITKFLQRSNFTKIVFQQGGMTIPVVIPFPRDSLKS